MTDQWIIYAATNAPDAADRLRKAGRDAVCVVRFERRAPCRHVRPKPQEDAPVKPAWGNYLYVQGRVDQPTRERARVRLWEVQCAGRPGYLRPWEVDLLFNPDVLWAHPNGKFFLDRDEAEARQRWRVYIRKHRKDQAERHKFRPGQRIAFEFAAQRFERDILEVRGSDLEVGLGLLGVERVRLHYADVESVEAA